MVAYIKAKINEILKEFLGVIKGTTQTPEVLIPTVEEVVEIPPVVVEEKPKKVTKTKKSRKPRTKKTK